MNNWWLQVMQVVQNIGDLLGKAEDPICILRSFLGNQLPQRQTWNVFEHQVGSPSFYKIIQHICYLCVMEGGEDSGFSVEQLERLCPFCFRHPRWQKYFL